MNEAIIQYTILSILLIGVLAYFVCKPIVIKVGTKIDEELIIPKEKECISPSIKDCKRAMLIKFVDQLEHDGRLSECNVGIYAYIERYISKKH